MPLIRVPKPWHLPESRITSESSYRSRRRFLKQLAGAGMGIAAASILGDRPSRSALVGDSTTVAPENYVPNADFTDTGLTPTAESLVSRYNNFYEFGNSKTIWRKAQALPTDDWKVEVTGLVQNPKIYDLDSLRRQFPLEERVYRFRCVEAWAMVVPWLGFPMRLMLEDVQPTAEAKFVRFQSFYDPAITTGPFWPPSASLPWPYTEGLRLDEMANELAFFALGTYGKDLPKQNGAPIRMVVPWKYGFKGAKSIVKIEFVTEQPATYWNTLAPSEYAFESNVNPAVPHPRWSQAEERLVGDGPAWGWTRQPTLPYNGYAEYVAHLYA
ncbi:protein-methionine-sulfoxide reductase catalytic subunit MsrP [Synechococcus sp. PCC 7336]|uniref:protein-methionine-sulfoxide reductase catalytic subunit MsrP n=1 Tax=Synechococcus sp. PCC 7336 TaxID=195250 RepID=UPI0003481456|nr:protein-methionine-sulfoxide reductase catalytic subunit MsrP [Synechococcus sp. PCC 7336]